MRIVFVNLLFILSLFAFDDRPALKKWVIMSGCSLKVDGNTNVNNFSCSINNYSKPDTILVNGNASPIQLRGNIKLDIENFDCHNLIMTADLRKTLKAKEYPFLIIRFVALNKYPDASLRQELLKGVVVIELAGVSRQFDVDYKVITAENAYINLVGFRRINFSDFNLTPPRKLGGMIRTNNELSVAFNLRMKVLD